MIKPTDRFATAADYVDAHPWAASIDPETREALISILVKHKRVWSPRRTVPRDPAVRCAWHAYQDVRHAAQWGYLPSHGATSKIAFFFAHHDEVERYSRLFDAFIALAKMQRTTRRAAA